TTGWDNPRRIRSDATAPAVRPWRWASSFKAWRTGSSISRVVRMVGIIASDATMPKWAISGFYGGISEAIDSITHEMQTELLVGKELPVRLRAARTTSATAR